MSDNVIILGAGFSAGAKIPLMKNFMDTMWTLARTGRCNGEPIPPQQLRILEEALKVREELDGYHGRAAFDVWNIEDVLSILSFSSRKRLEGMTKAIAQVIELTCQVKHNGQLNQHRDRITRYEMFWRALIAWADKPKLPIPPVLTFNYDLVLERSLLHALVGKHYRNAVKFDHPGIEIAYSGATCENLRFKCETAHWTKDLGAPQEPGMILKEFPSGTDFKSLNLRKFEILKLHGSVNFPRPRRGRPPEKTSAERLVVPLEDPLILPPIFNKATDAVGKGVWERALQVLRSCKRLIICGYSLPTTDIYMQYFLKAALGPNQDLDHIHVFDPVICDDRRKADADALRQRYACNFSQPIQRRIEFVEAHGTTDHLIHLLQNHPDHILFS